MLCLTDLPSEIHHQIIFYLQSNRDVAALSSQCQALHSLCDMPNRKKYRRVRITPKIADLDRGFEMLLDILRKPSLGRYVRHIEYKQTVSRHQEYVVEPPKGKLNEEDMWLLRSATQRAGFTGALEERVLNMLMRESLESVVGDGEDRLFGSFSDTRAPATYVAQALTALLVSVSPNLESMAMMPTFYTDLDWEEDDSSFLPSECALDLLIRDTNENPAGKPYLQNLRRVYIINLGVDYFDDGRVYVDMDFKGCLAILCNLPSLEWIGTDVLAEDRYGKPALEAKSSNVSRIAIHHSSVNTSYLTPVIRSCRVMKEFEYSIGGRGPHTNHGTHSIFNPKTFILSVLEHKTTLEKLDVDVEAHIHSFIYYSPRGLNFDGQDARAEAQRYWKDPPPDSFWDQRGCLKDFVALKRLSIGVNYLFYIAAGVNNDNENKDVPLVEYLPPNLEYLCIRGYEKRKLGMGAHAPFREQRWKHHDAQIDALKALVESGSTSLKEIHGVDECIPNAEDIEYPPEDYPDLLWTLCDEWSDEDDSRDDQDENEEA
ncbi:hypothetical protein CNMCM5793_004145 [Aspergillus hiratsukae]|uniref:F-box domain-containing protein n=1 Tax=Aspergillus hiratsukae TaxID=1194566 RepID=A0A8H6P2G2_9EURO|nr:hypothetical protein CNMCM5793_004145 [Aspergillus hiratsukae]KAF7159104.1 hypothetical protein CNMCM6106_006189 [Aspergillus hiratsukae]